MRQDGSLSNEVDKSLIANWLVSNSVCLTANTTSRLVSILVGDMQLTRDAINKRLSVKVDR
ncbi:hypothetical protein N7447_009934 [Penicillium robsamsonii]|uniref:uncharacterized protein n=1 Tax=Penicillium robsamsonii TaxID=1792511 RepID=UPI0025484EF0|nr:uncharacterized protein N7447_009934 [Penicillium robsamsonii]KAJ5812911.1 hypothetical protein N7447_009934 [Penicillium robsamsonii]